MENSVVLARGINTNSYVQEFLSAQYENPQSYVAHYYEFMRDSLIQGVMGIDNSNNSITLYADNETIINGGGCSRLSCVAEAPWYRLFEESGQKTLLLFHFDDWKSPYVPPERKMLFLQRLDRKFGDNAEKLLKIEVDYGSLVRNISNMNYDFTVCICNGDRLLFSNIGPNNTGQDFNRFVMTDAEAIGTIIASGDFPDFINGGEAMKALYDEGVLVAWDEYLEKYPNLKELYTDAEWNSFRQDAGHLFEAEPILSFAGFFYNLPVGQRL